MFKKPFRSASWMAELCCFCWNKDRFEESVIEERRRTAQDLLNFVGQRIYLTNSVIFKQFFQVCLFRTIITIKILWSSVLTVKVNYGYTGSQYYFNHQICVNFAKSGKCEVYWSYLMQFGVGLYNNNNRLLHINNWLIFKAYRYIKYIWQEKSRKCYKWHRNH